MIDILSEAMWFGPESRPIDGVSEETCARISRMLMSKLEKGQLIDHVPVYIMALALSGQN